MRQTSTGQTQSVLRIITDIAGAFAERPALCSKRGQTWVDISYRELAHRVHRLATSLIIDGLQSGDRLAICAESGPAWGICFFAGMCAGAIVVPVDHQLGENELRAILTDCAPRLLCVSAHLQATARTLQAGVSTIERIIVLDESHEDDASASIDQRSAPARLPCRDRSLEEVAVIIYTSGTTGCPKGVMITFANLLFQVRSFERQFKPGSGERFLSILPLHHLFELTCGFLGVLYTGGTICYAASLYPQDIAQCLRQRQITAMLAVPLFLTLLKHSIERQMDRQSWGSRLAYRWAMALASRMPWRGGRRALFLPLHRQFGGKLEMFICGGAPLEATIVQFFDRFGVLVLQGYGLTEASPVISVNTGHANRPGSVGQPLAGTEVRIDADESESAGEILTRGPHVMHGYHHRPELTRDVLDADGWLHTGDLGRLDQDGFLYITGRLKNLIVLGGGKKVQPEEVEVVLGHAVTVREVCVMGRLVRHGLQTGTEEVCAVVVPCATLCQRYAGRPEMVEEAIREECTRLGRELAPYKRPTRIIIHQGELPKTTSRKVQRRVVQQWLESQQVSYA
jgi:long-chain acyl-CoA synthetase